MTARRSAAAGVGLVGVLALLVACSSTGGGVPGSTGATSSGSSPSSASPPAGASSGSSPLSPTAPTSASTSAVPTDPNAAYGLDVPKRVTLTALGTTLRVGQQATVAWQPAAGTVGVLKLRVTRLRQGDIADLGAFELDDTARTSTPYYVDAIATNVGRTDLGGATVPLLLLDGAGTLVQSATFETTFAPCSARPLPSPYPRGATGPVCLVFLAPDHGTLASVAFRPQASYAPITWSGTVR